MMVTDQMIPSFDGTRLYCKKNIPASPKAVVVVVHGLCEHLRRYDYLTDKLTNKDFSVYRFDHRGHANSEGKRVYYNDYTEILEDVHEVVNLASLENPNLPIFLIGHSMGGYAVTLFGTKCPGKVQGFVLSGALTRYHTPCAGPLPIQLPSDTYLPNSLGGGVCSDPAVVEAYNNDPLVEKQISVGLLNSLYHGVEWLKANPSQFTDPVLMLHGCNDGLVSEKDSRDLFGEIGSTDKSIKIYANLFHEIFNEPCRDEVIDEAIEWIEARI
ncbi:alpha/beta hydrolase [Paenibacillus albiflavus]|uniref:Alpha/beta hydrolase n=1 Tax=Paenibacillus albiflavus TaxID=2545760 RepID=A0A4R4ECU9_9BACL|nr:alpha/beta hydrolase [Paenibacillus albiflavus]TCZ77786.1 alpha/beta hydrolase [Paenibacillus albiflavus]